MGSSLIGRIEKHQRQIRVLKRGNKGHERTCRALATASSLSTVLWTDLGEVSNWGSLVDNQRHGWVCWVLDYIEEPMARSIDMIRGRWPVNWRWRGGGRRGKKLLAQAIRGCYCGKTTSDE
jgi:surface antigen